MYSVTVAVDGERRVFDCATLKECARAMVAWIRGDNSFAEYFGSSQLLRGSGKVTKNGKHVATIHYNGTIEEK